MLRNESFRADSMKGPNVVELEVPETPSSTNSSFRKEDTGEHRTKFPRGWRPYAALLAGFCGMANCWGLNMSFGPYFKYYHEHLLSQAGAWKIGLIGSIQAFLILALSFIIGRLLDARLHRYIASLGCILTTVGHLGLSFTSGQGLRDEGRFGLILLTQGIIAGLGMACFFVHSSQLAVEAFPDHKYLAVGVTSAGGAAGGLVYPIAINFLLRGHGFRTGVRWHTAIIGATSNLVVAFGGPVLDSKKRPLGAITNVSKWIDTSAFKSKSFVLLSLAESFIFFGYSPLLFHVTEWACRDTINVVWFLSILNGCSIIGRLGSAVIASFRCKLLNPLVVHASSCFFSSILVIPLWRYADHKDDALALGVVFGILAGAMLGLPASCVAQIIPAKKLNSLGVWTGMMWSSCCILAMAGPPIAGVLHKKFTIEALGYWTGVNLIVAGLLSSFAMWAHFQENQRSMISSVDGDEEAYKHGRNMPGGGEGNMKT